MSDEKDYKALYEAAQAEIKQLKARIEVLTIEPNLQPRYGMAFAFPEPFLQKHLEQWQTALNKYSSRDVAGSVYNGALLKATIDCGWMTGLTVEKVAETNPGIIEWASAQVHFFIRAARRPPQE